MSIFRDHAFGYNTTEKQERDREMRRRINENLKNIYSGKYRREASEKREAKKTELERASADDIERGSMVIERRELDKRLKRLLLKSSLTPEENGEAEELQYRVDQIDDELGAFTRQELSRFVRVWNKSRKVKYKL